MNDHETPTYRKERDDGHLTITYGYDHMTGYFIMAVDSRLSISLDVPEDDEFNDLCQGLDPVGSGTYANAYTGEIGFGRRVEKKTMRKLWGLYGATDEEISSVR